MQKNVDGPIDMNSTIELLYMQRDQFNQFTSTSGPFDPATDGDYTESHEAIVEVILKTYADPGMKVRHERRTETIGGISFNVMDATILSPDGTKVILHQSMYHALLAPLSPFPSTGKTTTHATPSSKPGALRRSPRHATPFRQLT